VKLKNQVPFLGDDLSKETKEYINSIAKQLGFDKGISSANLGKFLQYWLEYKKINLKQKLVSLLGRIGNFYEK
jgi:hypothetical protein